MDEASGNWSHRLACGLMTAVLVAYALVCVIVLFIDRNVSYFTSRFNIPLLPNLAILVPVVASAFLLRRHFARGESNRLKGSVLPGLNRKISIIATVALFCYQVASLYFAGFLTGWDVSVVRTASVLPAPISQTLPSNDFLYSYFSRYPNNLLMLILLRAQDRFRMLAAPSITTGAFYALVSMLLVSLSFYLFTRVSAELFGHTKLSTLADTIYLVLVGLSPWYMIPYSDTYGLFLCTAMLWLLASHHDSVASFVSLGLLGAVGYNIKPTCVFVIISVCLAWLLESWGTAAFRKAILSCAVLATAFAISLEAINITIERLDISWDDDARITASHFAMMGLNDETDGVYYENDVQLSSSQPTVKAREETNKAVIRERLESYGPIGLTKHLVKKTLVNFNDGTFAWAVEGHFFEEPFGVAADNESNFFSSYIYPPESPTGATAYSVFCTIEQGLWIICLIGIPLGLLNLGRGKRPLFHSENQSGTPQATWLVIAYCVSAMLLFLLVFEARARYLYLYSGFFVLLGMNGYQQTVGWFAERQENPTQRQNAKG